MCPAKTIHFNSDTHATLLTVSPNTVPLEALQQLGITEYRGAIFMHSGAGEVSAEQRQKLGPIFKMLARFADDYRVLIADGGTNAGGMQLIGEARQAVGGSFPLLGVAVTGKVSYPGYKPASAEHYPLNAGHSHFLLVEADDFGAESDLLVGLAQARAVPNVAFVVNGGKIVEDESRRHAELGTPIVALKGSLRFADVLADNMTSGRIRLIYPMGTKLRTFDVEKQSPGEIYDLFQQLLFPATPTP
jgi:hypothetical protein